VDGQESVLFCPGICGAGKTSLASHIIHHLQTANDSGRIRVVTWIYCDYNDKASQSSLIILGSLLHQTLECLRFVPACVEALYLEHGKGQSSMNTTELASATQDVALISQARISLVLDALDEYTDLYDARQTLMEDLLALTPVISFPVTLRPVLRI
jgi:hypothetical protein